MIEILRAILLGVVEGITEFLPISSTGHLTVAERLINFKDTARAFTVIIQLGAILAVLWYYRVDLFNKVVNFIKGDKYDRHFGFALILATIPAGLLGLLLSNAIDTHENLTIIAVALIVGGFILLLADKRAVSYKSKDEYEMDDISYKHALIVGLAQSVSLIPGVSRSGASITGGLFAGLDRKTATKFSFYLSIPIMILASGYKLITGLDNIKNISGGWPALVAGFITSFIVASIVIRWLIWYVAHNTFTLFAIYRIVLGIALLTLIYNKTLTN